MSFNIFLAVIPVIFGWLMYLSRNRLLRYVYGLLWILFLPNSIYLFTDITNLIRQWGRVVDPVKLVFVFQYCVLVALGLLTYILALYPFERHLQKSRGFKKKYSPEKVIIVLNFIIGFGLTLGRVERVNSWEVFTQPQNVITAGFNILFSPELLVLTLLFGLFGNLLYFSARTQTIKLIRTYLYQVGVLR